MTWDISQFRDRVGIAATDFRYALEGPTNPGLWERAVVDRSETVFKVGRGYLQAGADLLIAFTERLNLVRAAEISDDVAASPEEIINLNHPIVSVLHEIAVTSERRPPVFCSLGPVEALWALEEIDEKTLHGAYSDQVRRCIDAGADGFLCRSFSELEPLRCAVRAIRAICDLPIIGSMTFDAGADAMRTTSGASIPEACRMLKDEGADMVGLDRGEFPDGAAAIVSLMVESGRLPVYAEINAGRSEIVEQRVVFREPANAFGERLERLRDAGATIVGGGLGTGRDHIAQLVRQRERLVRKGRRADRDDPGTEAG